jgi:hypothetical protein
VVEVVLEGGGVVDLESLLEPDEVVWTSGIGGDIVNVVVVVAAMISEDP